MGCGETIGGSSRVGRSVDVANQVARPVGAWRYARAPAARSEELADNILSSSPGPVPPVTRNELAMALSMLKKGSALGLDLLPSDPAPASFGRCVPSYHEKLSDSINRISSAFRGSNAY